MKELEEALVGQRVVACIGNYKWLGAFACIPPIYSTLVGAATTEEEGYALVQKHRPSLVFVSQHLDAGSGLSLVARIEALDSSVKTVLLADDSDISVVREALSYGCDGICFQSGRLLPAVKVVAGGGIYYPETEAAVLRQRQVAPPLEALSSREVEVLQGMMLGLTDQQISKRLIVSAETVKSHARSIYQKLGTTNRTQAVVQGIAAGIIALEDAINDDMIGTIKAPAARA